MAERAEDRRVRRTKRRLKEALLALLQERAFDALTVEAIAERADVGRSTFYAHFSSKEDLLFAGFDRWILSLADGSSARHACAAGGFRFSLPLLEHIATQQRFFHATIVQGASPAIRRRTSGLLATVIRQELEREERRASGLVVRTAEAELRRQADAHMVAASFLGLVAWWIEQAPKMPVHAVDAWFQARAGMPSASAAP